jgi:hypothetical protein
MTGLIALQQSAVTQLGRGGGGTVQPSCVDRARGGAATAAQVAAGTVRSMRVGPGLNLCAKRSSGAEKFLIFAGITGGQILPRQSLTEGWTYRRHLRRWQ